MKSAIGAVLVILGILVLLMGLATPATTTQTATTCYNDPTGYGQECVRSTYETPNMGKGGVVVAGISMAIIGGFMLSSDSSNSGFVETLDNSSSEQSHSKSLREQIREREAEKKQNQDGER